MTAAITREMKRKAIVREIAYRRRVYPRQVAAGKMTDGFAAVQIAILEAILEDYPEEPPAQGALL